MEGAVLVQRHQGTAALLLFPRSQVPIRASSACTASTAIKHPFDCFHFAPFVTRNPQGIQQGTSENCSLTSLPGQFDFDLLAAADIQTDLLLGGNRGLRAIEISEEVAEQF